MARGVGRVWLYLRVLPLVLLACNSESRHQVAQTLEHIFFGPSCALADCEAQAKAAGTQASPLASATQVESGLEALPAGFGLTFGLWRLITPILGGLEPTRRTDRNNPSRAPPSGFQGAIFTV